MPEKIIIAKGKNNEYTSKDKIRKDKKKHCLRVYDPADRVGVFLRIKNL